MPHPVAVITCGHPDRPHRALGMCQACYFRHWRRLTRERLQRRLGQYVAQQTF